MENKQSILQVAEAAGVGVGTVSRVLNHSTSVHPSTAAEVHAAVARLGYQLPPRNRRRGPRPGRQSKAPRAGSIIMVTVLGSQGLDWVLHCAPVYVGVLHGVESAIADRGCRMQIRQAANREALSRVLKADEPVGLVILGFEDSSTAWEAATLRQVPAVWTMGSPLDFHGDHIQPDHVRIGVLGARHLLKKGHRHCALIGSEGGSPAVQMQLRNEGFRWTIEAAGGNVLMLLDPQVIRRSADEHAVDTALLDGMVQQLVKTAPRPTALFLESDMLAPWVYKRLREAGIRPQQDIEIVTCNNEPPYLASLEPKPTIIDIQPQVIGRRTVDQLLWRLENRQAPLMRLMVEPLLVPHDTLPMDHA
jgi:DNA-binding LacI/PurR family transcriptional regulator